MLLCVHQVLPDFTCLLLGVEQWAVGHMTKTLRWKMLKMFPGANGNCRVGSFSVSLSLWVDPLTLCPLLISKYWLHSGNIYPCTEMHSGDATRKHVWGGSNVTKVSCQIWSSDVAVKWDLSYPLSNLEPKHFTSHPDKNPPGHGQLCLCTFTFRF